MLLISINHSGTKFINFNNTLPDQVDKQQIKAIYLRKKEIRILGKNNKEI